KCQAKRSSDLLRLRGLCFRLVRRAKGVGSRPSPRTDMTTNPLLAPQVPLPFDQVLPEHVEPAMAAHISAGNAALDAIAAGPADTYQGTFDALEKVTEVLETAMGMVEHLESVKTSDEFRKAYNSVQPHVSEFYSSIALHEGVYKALRQFAESP